MWKISIKKSLYKEDLTYLHEKLKNKAPNIILHEKQLKLYYFIEDFVDIKYKIFLEILIRDHQFYRLNYNKR